MPPPERNPAYFSLPTIGWCNMAEMIMLLFNDLIVYFV